ncbi:hypothetical protein ABD87_22815 [Lysinibacillus sphaericus]|uniref:hypothetical protein n=1 Tax=Lysinibacillus sphaericus TaxID=1421 RepID=UPI0018CEDFA8|nr:hypothetical protein [Lysinibacillus sphaericus]MBG9732260.1 hypothetical protein [Lysinibacillus sphaericus]
MESTNRKYHLTQRYGHIYKINCEKLSTFFGIGWISAPISFIEEENKYRGKINFHVKRLCLEDKLEIYDMEIEILYHLEDILNTQSVAHEDYLKNIKFEIAQVIPLLLDTIDDSVNVEIEPLFITN